jgi:Tfp pilus assembly protein PilE
MMAMQYFQTKEVELEIILKEKAIIEMIWSLAIIIVLALIIYSAWINQAITIKAEKRKIEYQMEAKVQENDMCLFANYNYNNG